MKTLTFYSYKGGAGRSLAMANAAIYLATLGFKVIAIDFDLEAPGLHYKFSRNKDGSPLAVKHGLVDYVNTFVSEGQVRPAIDEFLVDVPIPGVEKSLVRLLPAGKVPSNDYWLKLSRLNWHDLFYSREATGVQIFMELKARIADEQQPDFLLVDARTGITEMGGVATALFADKVICLVLPNAENLDGARVVLRSIKRSAREMRGNDLDILIAVSRLPKMRGAEEEAELTKKILSSLNKEAEDNRETLSLQSVFVLHSEPALQLQEALRVGSGINPDDSILLRDYLRLFVSFVPKESIEPKVRALVEQAWEKLRRDPDVAVKDMEELAESFGHPENYRELLRFYEVRNISGSLALRRAQRLWEISGDDADPIAWRAIQRSFEPRPRWQREKDWYPNLDFIRSMWRIAGKKETAFGMKLASAYDYEERDSAAADVLLEVINSTDQMVGEVVARCIEFLDDAKRSDEADLLIERLKQGLTSDPAFINAWARHAIRRNVKAAELELVKSSLIEQVRPTLRALLLSNVGMEEQASALADAVLKELDAREVRANELDQIGKYFNRVGRWEDFEESVSQFFSSDMVRQFRERAGVRLTRRPKG